MDWVIASLIFGDMVLFLEFEWVNSNWYVKYKNGIKHYTMQYYDYVVFLSNITQGHMVTHS